MHVFGISYSLITFGGQSWYNNSTNDPSVCFKTDGAGCFCMKNGCPAKASYYLWIMFNITFVFNIFRSIFVLVCLIRRDQKWGIDWDKTMANFKFIMGSGQSKLFLVIFIIVIPLLWAPLSAEWKRDLAGFYVFLAFFDCCFIWSNHWPNGPNKKMASMITWTEVVSKSIWDFLLVSIISCRDMEICCFR